MFLAEGAVMVRIDKDDLVVIPFKDREGYVLNTHLDALMPHMGENKLALKIREPAYVIGLHAVVNRIINACGSTIYTTIPSSYGKTKGSKHLGGKMYKEGVITRADLGKWQSPSFVVPKRAEQWVDVKWVPKTRFVVDFKKVNEQLVPDWLPAKPISHILAEVQASGTQYFSTIDIQSAFFSIQYDENTVEPTAFYADCGNSGASNGECLTGLWKFLRMIMGAQHSSSVLFRAMSMILKRIALCKSIV